MSLFGYIGFGFGTTQTSLDTSEVVKVLNYFRTDDGYKGYSSSSYKGFSIQKELGLRYIFDSRVFTDVSLFIGLHHSELIFDAGNYNCGHYSEVSKLKSRFIMGAQLKLGYYVNGGCFYLTSGISDLKFEVNHKGEKKNPVHFATPFWGIGAELRVANRANLFMEFQHKISAKDKAPLPEKYKEEMENQKKRDPNTKIETPNIQISSWRMLTGFRVSLGGQS